MKSCMQCKKKLGQINCAGNGLCLNCFTHPMIMQKEVDPLHVDPIPLRKIEKETDVKQTILEMLERADHLDGVIVLGLTKDGSQFLKSSTLRDADRALLYCFFQSYVNSKYRDSFG